MRGYIAILLILQLVFPVTGMAQENVDKLQSSPTTLKTPGIGLPFQFEYIWPRILGMLGHIENEEEIALLESEKFNRSAGGSTGYTPQIGHSYQTQSPEQIQKSPGLAPTENTPEDEQELRESKQPAIGGSPRLEKSQKGFSEIPEFHSMVVQPPKPAKEKKALAKANDKKASSPQKQSPSDFLKKIQPKRTRFKQVGEFRASEDEMDRATKQKQAGHLLKGNATIAQNPIAPRAPASSGLVDPTPQNEVPKARAEIFKRVKREKVEKKLPSYFYKPAKRKKPARSLGAINPGEEAIAPEVYEAPSHHEDFDSTSEEESFEAGNSEDIVLNEEEKRAIQQQDTSPDLDVEFREVNVSETSIEEPAPHLGDDHVAVGSPVETDKKDFEKMDSYGKNTQAQGRDVLDLLLTKGSIPENYREFSAVEIGAKLSASYGTDDIAYQGLEESQKNFSDLEVFLAHADDFHASVLDYAIRQAQSTDGEVRKSQFIIDEYVVPKFEEECEQVLDPIAPENLAQDVTKVLSKVATTQAKTSLKGEKGSTFQFDSLKKSITLSSGEEELVFELGNFENKEENALQGIPTGLYLKGLSGQRHLACEIRPTGLSCFNLKGDVLIIQVTGSDAQLGKDSVRVLYHQNVLVKPAAMDGERKTPSEDRPDDYLRDGAVMPQTV